MTGTAAQPLTLMRLCVRNLTRQRLRTTLTVMGVAIGVLAVVAFGALARGTWESTDQAMGLDNDLTVFQAGVAADLLSKLDEAQTRQRLMADPDIAEACGVLLHLLPVAGQPFTIILGADTAELERGRHIIRGRPATADGEIQIGSLAEKLMERTVGDTIDINGRPCRVVGVFHSGVVFFDGAVVIPLKTLQEALSQTGRVTSFNVRLKPGADPGVVVERIERAYPELVAVTGAADYHKVDRGLEVLNGMTWAVGALAVLVGGLVVTNTMWLTVHERTREIGVLRAVGWSRRNVVLLVVAESCGVGVLAFLVGVPAGAGAAHIATMWSPISGFADPVIHAAGVLKALGVSVVLSVLGALLPAWRAAGISPVEALRYE